MSYVNWKIKEKVIFNFPNARQCYRCKKWQRPGSSLCHLSFIHLVIQVICSNPLKKPVHYPNRLLLVHMTITGSLRSVTLTVGQLLQNFVNRYLLGTK